MADHPEPITVLDSFSVGPGPSKPLEPWQTAVHQTQLALASVGQHLEGTDAGFTYREVRQSLVPGLKVIHASGWADGGHRALRQTTFAVRGDEVFVLRAETANVDADGYRQRLVDLRLCPVSLERDIAKLGMSTDLKAISATVGRRDRECRSMLPEVLAPLAASLHDKARLDALLGWVAALMGGAPIAGVARSVAAIRDPRVKAALGSPKPLANVQWVGGKSVPFKAFTTEVKGATLKAAGMAADDWLMQLTVSFDGKALNFERANVARAIEFIE